MAYWRYRKRNGVVTTEIQGLYYDGEKQAGVPRHLYKHLDGEPTEVIDEWFARWTALNEVHQLRPELTKLPLEWHDYIKDFCEDLAGPPKHRDEKTIKDHKRHLEDSLPFFASVGCMSLAQFPAYSRKLYPWLLEVGKSEERIWKINGSIRMFWRFLDDKGLVDAPLKLAGGRRAGRKTPLKLILTPQDILSAKLPRIRERPKREPKHPVKAQKVVALREKAPRQPTARDDTHLITLIGYFFSLRPQEVFALRPIDFKAGPDAKDLECCRVMEKAGFWNKLAINVWRQRSGNKFKDPKADSAGWVACFDEKGAREIVKFINSKPPEELLFKFGNDRYYKMWRQSGIEKTVCKDMRRASLYHLGNNTSLPVVALKNHARHKNIETTMLYTRRPEEELTTKEWKLLDMDA